MSSKLVAFRGLCVIAICFISNVGWMLNQRYRKPLYTVSGLSRYMAMYNNTQADFDYRHTQCLNVVMVV